MKRLLLIFAAVTMFAACNDDDKMFYGPNGPASTPQAALPQQANGYMEATYPDARIVDVDFENGVVEVEINDNGTRRDVYFTADGEWLRTTTDVKYQNLPQEILDAIAASEYAAWRADDADWVESPEGEWYEVELEERGTEREVIIRIAADGTILGVTEKGNGINDTDIRPQDIPQEVMAVIEASEYASWRIEDAERVTSPEGTLYDIDLEEPGTEREVNMLISADGVLLRTTIEVLPQEIPQEVLAAIEATEYAAWHIDEAKLVQSAEGSLYIIELDDPASEREVYLKIAADGTILN